jgi:hypothetical protein
LPLTLEHNENSMCKNLVRKFKQNLRFYSEMAFNYEKQNLPVHFSRMNENTCLTAKYGAVFRYSHPRTNVNFEQY